MANYTITAASVLPSSSAKTRETTAGATITAGQPVYLDTADVDAKNRPKAKLADANASATTAAVAGIALNGAASGQPLRYVYEDDDFTHGLTTPPVGTVVAVSATAGALCPVGDLTTGDYPALCMITTSATAAKLFIAYGTAAKP